MSGRHSPSQIAYYFGIKHRLFVETACHDVRHAAGEVERAGARARTPAEYARAIVTEALAQPGLLTFAEAMLLAGRHPELSEPTTRTFEVLHRKGYALSARSSPGTTGRCAPHRTSRPARSRPRSSAS